MIRDLAVSSTGRIATALCRDTGFPSMAIAVPVGGMQEDVLRVLERHLPMEVVDRIVETGHAAFVVGMRDRTRAHDLFRQLESVSAAPTAEFVAAMAEDGRDATEIVSVPR